MHYWAHRLEATVLARVAYASTRWRCTKGDVNKTEILLIEYKPAQLIHSQNTLASNNP